MQNGELEGLDPKEVTVSEEPESGGAQVIDLMEALRASLGKSTAAPAPATADEAPARAAAPKSERKPPKRAPETAAAAPKTRARKTA